LFIGMKITDGILDYTTQKKALWSAVVSEISPDTPWLSASYH
jgi:hypothetical protein